METNQTPTQNNKQRQTIVSSLVRKVFVSCVWCSMFFFVLVEPTFMNTRVEIVNMEPDMNMVWKRGQSFRIFTGDSKKTPRFGDLWDVLVPLGPPYFNWTSPGHRALKIKGDCHVPCSFWLQGLPASDLEFLRLLKKPVSLQHLLHHSLHTRSFSNK